MIDCNVCGLLNIFLNNVTIIIEIIIPNSNPIRHCKNIDNIIYNMKFISEGHSDFVGITFGLISIITYIVIILIAVGKIKIKCSCDCGNKFTPSKLNR